MQTRGMLSTADNSLLADLESTHVLGKALWLLINFVETICRGDGSPQGLTATPATHATADAKSQWFSAGPISDAERLAAAAERNQAASTSTSSVVGTPRWRDTGIELAKGKEKDDDGVTMTVKESDKYYLKEFGEDPRYEKLFGEQLLDSVRVVPTPFVLLKKTSS